MTNDICQCPECVEERKHEHSLKYMKEWRRKNPNRCKEYRAGIRLYHFGLPAGEWMHGYDVNERGQTIVIEYNPLTRQKRVLSIVKYEEPLKAGRS